MRWARSGHSVPQLSRSRTSSSGPASGRSGTRSEPRAQHVFEHAALRELLLLLRPFLLPLAQETLEVEDEPLFSTCHMRMMLYAERDSVVDGEPQLRIAMPGLDVMGLDLAERERPWTKTTSWPLASPLVSCVDDLAPGDELRRLASMTQGQQPGRGFGFFFLAITSSLSGSDAAST